MNSLFFMRNRSFQSFRSKTTTYLEKWRYTCKKRYSILQQHGTFVDLVKDYGTGDIICDINDKNIVTIKISNPDERNAISGRMMVQLGQIIDDLFHSDKKVSMKGIIITGSNGFFSSGASLSLANDRINTSQKGRLMAEYMTEILNTIRNSNVVSLCDINGPAIGGGAELITSTDFRIQSSTSYIQFIHTNIGASPGWGGIRRLQSIVGRNRTLFLFGTCQKVYSKEALSFGLVDEVITIDFHNENDKDRNSQAHTFLSKFYDHNSFVSIQGIKEVIVASDAKILTEEQIQTLEKDVFESRWFCDENKRAIDRFLRRKSGESK